MKKTLLALLLALAMVVSMGVATFAEYEIPEEELPYFPTIINDKINYGTAIVDGKLDARYADSFQARTGVKPNWGFDESTASAVCYILWDEAYFYFCIVVNDNNIGGQSADWIEENLGKSGGPWANETVELHLAWNGADDDRYTSQKWGCDYEGYQLYTNYGRNFYEGYEDAKWKTTVDEANNQWIVEIALPNAEGLSVGDEIGFEFQLNDLVDFAGNNGEARVASFFGLQEPFQFLYELVDDGKFTPVIVPTEPKTDKPTEPATDAPTDPETPTGPVIVRPTEPATDAPTKAPTENPTQPATNPSSGNNTVLWIIIGAAVVVVAVVVIVVLSKKKI